MSRCRSVAPNCHLGDLGQTREYVRTDSRITKTDKNLEEIIALKLEKFPLIFRFGIRQKVVLVLVTVLLTALSISGWLALQEEKKNVLGEIQHRGTDLSRFTSKALSFSVVGYDYHTVQLLLDEISSSEDVGYARVLGPKGNIMAQSGKLPEQSNKDQDLVVFKEAIKIDDKQVGQLTLGFSTRATIQRLESQKYGLIFREALIILLIAIAEFVALSLIIIRPVRLISDSLNDNVDPSGKITGDIPIHTQDEFGSLAKRFNSLRRQLNESNDALQSKVESADEKLISTNKQLESQSRALKIVNEEYKRLAMTDPLTGLFNRRHFRDLVETEIALSRRHGDTNSILLIDIDRFKSINDTYGHLEGDIVLESFAELLRENTRTTDILCRMGGEEFVVLCRRADIDSAIAMAEKLRISINSKPFKFGGEEINISASIGISTFPHKNIKNIDDLIKQADVAMYFCKENGRNQVAHYTDIQTKTGGNVRSLPLKGHRGSTE